MPPWGFASVSQPFFGTGPWYHVCLPRWGERAGQARDEMAQRARFSSNIGFLLVSAGCAIGLGNVWRFPYITGEYGGAAFILLYIFFLVLFGLPMLTMEYTVGRASQKSISRAFDVLEPEGTKWHFMRWVGFIGNFMLMMIYTCVAGWMLNYFVKMSAGEFNGMDTAQVGGVFEAMLANPGEVVLWTVIVCVVGMLVCGLGVNKGVERVTKFMMCALFVILLVLVIRAVTLPGAEGGLAFYLMPDFSKMFANGPGGFAEVVYAAMGQSFFTLSIGIGSMEIFGSYLGKERRIFGQALSVGVLDTIIALMAGLIIFPACFAFGVDPGSGPGLVFVTLPNVFAQMWLGQLWGALFFLFMSFAALSTVIAVFENIIAMFMDYKGWDRPKTVRIALVLITILSLPCALGFNVLAGVQVPGIGDIQGIEDFIVSNNLLPLGSLVFLLFCTRKFGWGWKNFIKEVDTGEGMRFPQWMHGWVSYCIPVLLIIVFVMGWMPIIGGWLGL